MTFIKKILFSYLLSIILTTALFANKIDLTTHGRLSLGYFGNSFGFLNTSAFGLNAYVMADFGITEHWSIGMGATGIWNIWSLFPFNNIMHQLVMCQIFTSCIKMITLKLSLEDLMLVKAKQK